MKYLLTILLAAAHISTYADDYTYITAQTQSGEENSVELAAVKKITFSESEVRIITTSGTLQYALADMKKIYFAMEPTDVKTLKEESASMKYANHVLEVQGSGVLCVYSTAGALQYITKTEGSAKVSLESLPQGTYIITYGDETIKVVR